MRAKEFIVERTGKHHPVHAAAHRGISIARDPGGYYPSYHQMRTGMVIGTLDGSGKVDKNVDHESWMGPYWTQHPYTKEEYNMFRDARKIIPTEHHAVQPWSKSEEMKDTHKISPIPKRKVNKHGV